MFPRTENTQKSTIEKFPHTDKCKKHSRHQDEPIGQVSTRKDVEVN